MSRSEVPELHPLSFPYCIMFSASLCKFSLICLSVTSFLGGHFFHSIFVSLISLYSVFDSSLIYHSLLWGFYFSMFIGDSLSAY